MPAAKPGARMGDFLQTSVNYYILRKGDHIGEFGRPSGATRAAPRSAPAGGGALAPRIEAKGELAVTVDGGFSGRQKEVAELCKRRFFYRQAFDIYGGVGGFYTYGPPGCALKNNLTRRWRQHFVIEENLLEIEDTCIMQHQVLKASGHVDRFNDFIVKDVKNEDKFWRADKLLEDVMEAKMEEPGVTAAQKKEYEIVKNQADAYSREEITKVFHDYGIKAPESGNDLTDPVAFNLMFPTPIGPGGYLQGYLRPETAQGIFLNYKFCLEQNGNKLPFGVAQVGRAFRNEIAPRAGLTRQREFTQAEIEYFVNPKNKAHPKFKRMAALRLQLFPSPQQLAGESPIVMTLGDAVASGTIDNETLGYMIGRTHAFLTNAGIVPQHLRFRQHLPTEMAHYAKDCWDAEINCSYGWLECVGIADRSCFDLNAHAKAAKCDLNYKETLEKPIETEVCAMTKPSGIQVMKAFKKDGKAVKEWIEALPQDGPDGIVALEASVSRDGSKVVEVDGKTFELNKDLLVFERKTEKVSVNSFTPGVVEPSFGIDRILFSILEHAYFARPHEEDSEEKQTRGVLRLAADVAPYKCTLLPLDQRISRHPLYHSTAKSVRQKLNGYSLSYTSDESGATVGKRYSRNDELGIPFAITWDFNTIEEADGWLTLRERDTMDQAKMRVSEVADQIRDICLGAKTWESILPKYTHRRSGQEEWTEVKGGAPARTDRA